MRLTLLHFLDLQTVLPAAARDVYYRDEIGNISTSAMRELDDMVEVELRPRFPLFGGWKTKYTIGYNVPSYQYLFNSGKMCSDIVILSRLCTFIRRYSWNSCKKNSNNAF